MTRYIFQVDGEVTEFGETEEKLASNIA